jgi:putative flippase GtrA
MNFKLIKTLTSWANIKSFFLISYRHAIISGLCASTEFSIFMLMFSYMRFNLPFSYIASFVIATFIGFIGHSIFTFKVGRLYKRNALFFSVQASCALALGYLIVSLLINYGFYPSLAKGVQLCLIFCFNITFGKFLSFRK